MAQGDRSHLGRSQSMKTGHLLPRLAIPRAHGVAETLDQGVGMVALSILAVPSSVLGGGGQSEPCPRGWYCGGSGHQGAVEAHLCPQRPAGLVVLGACACPGVGELQKLASTQTETSGPRAQNLAG